MSDTCSEDRFVKIAGAWFRLSAVQAVRATLSGRTGIYLASGQRIDVGDVHGRPSPDEVVETLARAGVDHE